MNLIKYVTKTFQSAVEKVYSFDLVISFSGGKDSCAMLAYICEKYPNARKHIVFADTGWEHDDAEEWCQSIAARFNQELHIVRAANKDFFSMVEHRQKFPGAKYRQCTSDLKRGPIQKWIRNNCGSRVVQAIGIRAQESVGRAKQKPLKRNKSLTNSKRTVYDWFPIFDWTEDEVKQYLVERNIPLHPVYEYLPRFSCQVCIFNTPKELNAIRDNNPTAFNKIADLEKKIGFTLNPKGTITEVADSAKPKRLTISLTW